MSKENEVANIRLALRELLDEVPISLASMARRMDINEHTLAHFLDGNRSPSSLTLAKISNYIKQRKKMQRDAKKYISTCNHTMQG